MTRKTTLTLAAAAILIATPALAKPSVNDMTACLATVNFVKGQLKALPKGKHDKANIKALSAGLNSYGPFLQDTHIAPGLLKFNGGDKKKAKVMQGQVDAYHDQLVAAMKARFKGERLYTDQAMMLDGCYTKAPMDAAGTAKMKAALEAMVAIAMKG